MSSLTVKVLLAGLQGAALPWADAPKGIMAMAVKVKDDNNVHICMQFRHKIYERNVGCQKVWLS